MAPKCPTTDSSIWKMLVDVVMNARVQYQLRQTTANQAASVWKKNGAKIGRAVAQ